MLVALVIITKALIAVAVVAIVVVVIRNPRAAAVLGGVAGVLVALAKVLEALS